MEPRPPAVGHSLVLDPGKSKTAFLKFNSRNYAYRNTTAEELLSRGMEAERKYLTNNKYSSLPS